MTTDATASKRAVITDAQVQTINAARAVLAEIGKANHGGFDTQASGMIFALAAVASDSLFQLLNWYDAHGHGELTVAQLHNER